MPVDQWIWPWGFVEHWSHRSFGWCGARGEARSCTLLMLSCLVDPCQMPQVDCQWLGEQPLSIQQGLSWRRFLWIFLGFSGHVQWAECFIQLVSRIAGTAEVLAPYGWPEICGRCNIHGTTDAPRTKQIGTAQTWTDLNRQMPKSPIRSLSNLSSKEGELDDEKVFELIRGEWVEAKEDEEDCLSRVWRGAVWWIEIPLWERLKIMSGNE